MTNANPPVAARPRGTPVLTVSLLVIAAAIFTQAVLAGLFISNSADAERIHLMVGSALPWLAIIPAVAAWIAVGRRRIRPAFGVAATVLLVGVWVQDVLGHIGIPQTIAVHVPLGVSLFALSGILALFAVTGRARRADPLPG